MALRRIKKRTKKVDKVIKGLIIGGAIGSVVGVSLTPKEKRKQALSSAKKLFDKSKPAPPKQEPKKKPGLLRGMRALVFGKRK